MMRLALAVLVVSVTVSAYAGPSRGYSSSTIFGNRETDDNLPSSFYEPLKPAKKTKSKTPPKAKANSTQQVVAASEKKPKAPPKAIDVTKEARDERKVVAKLETKDNESKADPLETKAVYAKPAGTTKPVTDPKKKYLDRGRSQRVLELAPKYRPKRHGFGDWP